MTGYRVVVIARETSCAAPIVQMLNSTSLACKVLHPRELETLVQVDMPDVVLVVSDDGGDLAQHVLTFAKQLDERMPVLIVALGDGEVGSAVAIMKAGAYDYMRWPVEAERLAQQVEHAARLYRLTKRVFLLEQHMQQKSRFDGMIGHSHNMQEVFQLIRTVAPTNATVLITGESGTGKELVARAIHRHSNRAANSFMDLNCGAIPHNLLENELFGHERGAYTGAERRYIGCCERAHQGTLFLDEICEMPLALQVKILRLLQERNFARVGGNDKIDADLRFVAATNRVVQEEVAKGTFREDLFYRLNVVPIHLPALRERSEDIPALVHHFVEKFATKLEKPFVDVEHDAIELLMQHTWPGNVRELENTIERVLVLNNDTSVKAKHLPPTMQKQLRRSVTTTGPTAIPLGDAQTVLPLDVVERYAIEAALEKCVWNVGEAAKRLKIGQATLYRKIRQYGLRH